MKRSRDDTSDGPAAAGGGGGGGSGSAASARKGGGKRGGAGGPKSTIVSRAPIHEPVLALEHFLAEKAADMEHTKHGLMIWAKGTSRGKGRTRWRARRADAYTVALLQSTATRAGRQ